MTASLKSTDKIDLAELSRRISLLMTNYCDAFSACSVIPRLSVLPVLKSYLQLAIWEACLVICIFLVPIDIFLFPMRRIFGRPKLTIGRPVYAFLGEPLRSVWKGEIPAFKIISLRYLSRLLLFYRAQSKINALHRVFNRRHLDLLVVEPPDDGATGKAEKFQKSFDLFQKITTDTYQIGALAIGGPLVALLTIAVQQGFLPLVNYAWKYFGSTWAISPELIGTLEGFFVLFAIITTWILVSAWMDMRSVINSLHLPEIECGAYECAGIKLTHQFPFDILFFVGLFGIGGGATYYLSLNSGDVWSSMTPTATILTGLGLVALARRLWLSRVT
jgi:hypothetical protein